MTLRRLPALTNIFVLIFTITAIDAILVRLKLWDLFEYKIWGDRALARAFFSENGLPLASAELKVLGRVPGNALYVILDFLEKISLSPVLAYMFQVGLDILAIGVVFWATLRYGGLLAASVAGILYALSIPILQNMVQLWNLGFVPLPAAMLLYAALRTYVDRQYGFLLVIFLVAGIAVQFHLSFYLLLLATLIPLTLHLNRKSLRYLVIGIGLFFAVQGSYWIFEIANDFPNTTLIFSNPVDATAGTQPIWISIMSLLMKLSGGRIIQLENFASPLGVLNSISMILLNLFLLIAYIGGFLSLALPSSTPVAVNDQRVRQTGLILMFICAATVLLVSLFSLGASIRYVLTTVPFVSAFAGIGFASLLSSRFARPAIASGRMVPAVLIVGFLFAIIGKSVYYRDFLPPSDLHTHGVLSRIMSQISREFGITGQNFEERVSLATSAEKGVISNFHPKKKFSYLSQVVFHRRHPDGQDTGECVFVTTPETARSLSDGGGEPKLRFGGFGENATVTRSVRDKDFVLIGYRTVSGNCVKSTSNPYVFTSSTEHLRTEWSRLASPELLGRRAVSVGDTHVFRAGVQGLFGGGVILSDGPAGVRAKLFSTNLKGSGGRFCPPGEWKLTDPSPLEIWDFTLTKPTLVFEHSRTKQRSNVRIFDGTLGAELSGLQSPWEKRDIRLEKGVYTVSFTGRIKFKCSSQPRDIRILLTERLVVSG